MYYVIAEEDAFGVLDWRNMEHCKEYVLNAKEFTTLSEAERYVDEHLDYAYKVKFHIEGGMRRNMHFNYDVYQLNELKKF